MRICEITNGRYYVRRKGIFRKPAYARPLKKPPKPNKIYLTPLQLKNRQHKLQQAYANTVVNTLEKRPISSTPKTIEPSKPSSNIQQGSADEMDTFIKIVRGELPRKPHFDSNSQSF